jgi:uncharacterized Zn-binding protein involved in type VI secretion
MTKMKKLILVLALVLLLVFPLTACDINSLADLQAWYQEYLQNQKNSADNEDGLTTPIVLKLTYPAGRSPSVFTSGWVFGAVCTSNGKDLSSDVQWSGSGSFSPSTGSMSRPSFSGEGANTITLSVTVAGKNYTTTVNVNAVSPAGYACVGMMANCPADAHGGPVGINNVTGPITTGSSHVFVNGKPAARVGDVGVHAACEGPNTFEIVSGDSNVLIDGRAAAKIGSVTKHCGGMGHIIGGN